MTFEKSIINVVSIASYTWIKVKKIVKLSF